MSVLAALLVGSDIARVAGPFRTAPATSPVGVRVRAYGIA